MAAAPAPPVWINLEYLSAEPWIESVHGLPSPHPRLPLTRWFFFPGFTRPPAACCASATSSRGAMRSQQPARDPAQPLVVSLFCYPNAALPALLDAWSRGAAAALPRAARALPRRRCARGSATIRQRRGAACTRGA